MLLRLILFLGCLCTFCSSCNLDWYRSNISALSFIFQKDNKISDRVANMTLEEKVGQLLLYKTTHSTTCNEDFLYNIVESGQVGTLILDNYTVQDYVRVTSNCNKLSSHPLWYATTESVSLNNQFSDVIPFPKAATVGAINDPKIHKEIRDLYIDQCRALGIHLNLSIPISSALAKENYDSNHFGQDKMTLSTHINGKVHALSRYRILSGGHLINDFALKNSSYNLLNEETLGSYRKLAETGLAAVTINHSNNFKSQFPFFSNTLIKNYLHYGIGFDGFLFSTVEDISNIKQLLDQDSDILIVEDDIELVYNTVLEHLQTGIWSEEKLNQKVEKILKAKSWTLKGQSPQKKLDAKKINHLLKYPHFKTYVQSCFQQSVALVKNKKLPYKNVHQQKFQVLHFDDITCTDLIKRMQKYGTIEVTPITIKSKKSVFKNTTARLYTKPNLNHITVDFKDGFTKILVLDIDLEQYNKSIIKVINDLAQKEDITIINFGNPYHLQALNAANIIQVAEQNEITEEFVAELLFGAQTANGKLTVNISNALKMGSSIQTPTTRLNYNTPEMMGLDTDKLEDISTIVQKAIKKKAIPGCQVLIARKGSIIYNKSFGHHTYDEKISVQNDDLYDLASLTKTTATTLATMKLYEQNRLTLDDNMEQCFGDKCGQRLKKTKIKNLLLHTSRLQANMPIYGFINRNGIFKNECNSFFCGKKRKNYRTKIADHFYMNDDLKPSLLDKVLGLKLRKSKRYRYSDVNFNLLQQVIEEETKLALDKYVYQNFYTPLNLKRCLYKPTSRYYKTKIVPTAKDQKWRKQLLHGFVHDESAALLGGVGGNAGLFSNAEDLAVLYQMLLNGGSYGGTQFLKTETVDLFTKKQAGSRRGLGFDKPRKTKYPSYSVKASSKTFGHTGFTGTAVWVDPNTELVYIFLSNRIHPKPNNTKLFKLKTRRRIHDVVYKALDTVEVKLPSFSDKL